MKVIGTIQGCEILLHHDGHISFIADADIDCDGLGGNPAGDPFFQADTSLHNNGKALTAETEAYIVVPPLILEAVPGIILGCQARIHYRETGKWSPAVVGDIGPRVKIGELSVKAANNVGMASNPNTGGENDMRMVIYELWPGCPAEVEGVKYNLQMWRK